MIVRTVVRSIYRPISSTLSLCNNNSKLSTIINNSNGAFIDSINNNTNNNRLLSTKAATTTTTESTESSSAPNDQLSIKSFLNSLSFPPTIDYSSKFTSWNELLNINSRDLKLLTIPIKHRKKILAARESYLQQYRLIEMRSVIVRERSKPINQRLSTAELQEELYNVQYKHIYDRIRTRSQSIQLTHEWRNSIIEDQQFHAQFRNQAINNGFLDLEVPDGLGIMKDPYKYAESMKQIIKYQMEHPEELEEGGSYNNRDRYRNRELDEESTPAASAAAAAPAATDVDDESWRKVLIDTDINDEIDEDDDDDSDNTITTEYNSSMSTADVNKLSIQQRAKLIFNRNNNKLSNPTNLSPEAKLRNEQQQSIVSNTNINSNSDSAAIEKELAKVQAAQKAAANATASTGNQTDK